MATEDFSGSNLQIAVNIKDIFKSAGKRLQGFVVQNIDEVSQGTVVVFRYIGLQIIHAVFAPARCEFVILTGGTLVGEIGRVGTLPQIPMILNKPFFEPLFIDVFEVIVEPMVHSVDE